MTCCKEKVVLVAVYEEKPRKKRLTKAKGKVSDNIKHHHHHHHHHIHVHESKNNNKNKGNRRAELLSYSQHLRESSKTKASTPPPHPPKSLVASSPTKDQETIKQVHDDQQKQKLKKQSGRLNMNNMFKCFAISYAKRKAKKKTKKKKKKSNESSSHKANLIMKQFSARTQKGASRFFIKLKAFIQKHR
ncbi:hypothetical protein SSX86_021795 [Deinandra increscens subsp. villosa]|uniref:Uncharacterized protein n=1 Tax=Deinandra increscens subsp. villosa TaxID=3103831 RepID=A0AAP0GRR6_9ASTR